MSVLKSLFNKAAGLNVYNSIKKRLQHCYLPVKLAKFRSSHPEVFLRKGALKICSTHFGMGVLL